MKYLFTFLVVATLIANAWAQSPEKISYQALIRNNTGLVLEKDISMQISILKDSDTGTAVYTELHSASTNANGIVTVEIGTGTTTDDFSTINWAEGTYFIKTETDPESGTGTNYTIEGTSQLLSVPYALHAATADSIIGGGSAQTQTLADVLTEGNSANAQIKDVADPTDANDAATKAYVDLLEGKLDALEARLTALEPPSIGDFRNGGVVFYIFQSGDPGYVTGEHHGLICSVADEGSSAVWGCTGTSTNANGSLIGTGLTNTSTIVAACTDAGIAADLCNSSTANSQSDWYLPSKDELNKMYENKATINSTALLNGGSEFGAVMYWSSTEHSADDAWLQSFDNGSQINVTKQLPQKVRAIRTF